ncbi:MAG: hypothetical protein R3C45_12195 [Phycisphaerales bacterium]
MLRKLSIYVPLLVLTLITLVPFAYLVCSAFTHGGFLHFTLPSRVMVSLVWPGTN